MTAIFAKLTVEGIARSPIALAPVADAIVSRARANASNGRHAYGTPTPAQPGEGPAQISGTLRNSITRTNVTRTGTGAEVKVGTEAGAFPGYGKGRTPSSKYGYYLETGLKNGTTFPFLKPAFDHGVNVVAPSIYKKAYGDGWKRLA
jgi:hypothetical protein